MTKIIGLAMRELEPCPSCGSGDVGGASGIVHCYRCKEQVQRETTPEAVEAWNIRAIFMRHEFFISPGLYKAAAELLARERAARTVRTFEASADGTDEAREFLVEYMRDTVGNATFAEYIRTELAGDFAWTLANHIAKAKP